MDKLLISALTLTGLCLAFASAADVSVATNASGTDFAKEQSLTPSAGASPRINGAKVFGARPGAPFLYRVAATGNKPLSYSAQGLPPGLVLDSSNGRISGSVALPGSYAVTVTVNNSVGSATAKLRIVIGEQLCLTPLMGWSSWYSLGMGVTQEKIAQIADAMVATGLADHGWTYVNIDDAWQGARGGKFNALQGNEKFPDLKGLCDHLHAIGLKAGIYSTVWMGSYAGFRGGTWESEKADYDSKAVPPDQRQQPSQIFGNYPNVHKLKLSRVAPFWFCDGDNKQFAEWGVDFVKYDWRPNDVVSTKRLSQELRSSGRDIILSLSNSTLFENIPQLASLAQMWRTTGDITDTWESMSKIGFEQDKWAPYQSPGHWNDPDMLQVGILGMGKAKPQHTRLTPDEQYSQVSLWCLLGAPLIISCDITKLDPFTFGLLSNDEVIEVDQDALGAPPRKLKTNPNVLVRPLENGSLAVGLFNRTNAEKKVSLQSADLGLKDGRYRIRDLWRQKDLGTLSERFEGGVPAHGVVFLRIFKP